MIARRVSKGFFRLPRLRVGLPQTFVGRVKLNGGQRFKVDHPGALVMRDGVAVFLAPGGVSIWFDHDSVNKIIGAPSNNAI